MADVAMRCDERCLRRERPSDWVPSISEELGREMGAQTDALVRATKGQALTLLEWAGIVKTYKETRREFGKVVPKYLALTPKHPIRKEAVRLQADQKKIDQEILASGGTLDGLHGLRGLGFPYPGAAAATPVVAAVASPWQARAITIGAVVVIAGWLAYLIKDWLERTASLLICTKAAEKVPAAERAAFIAECNPTTNEAAKWWRRLKVVGVVALIGGVGYIAVKRRWHKNLPYVGRFLPGKA